MRIDKKSANFKKLNIFQYIKLVFYTRVFYRQWTIIVYLLAIFSFLFFLAAINIYIGTPTVSLDKMETKKGIVKEVLLKSKGLDELVLMTTDKTYHRFVLSVGKSTKNKILYKQIQIWYLESWNLYHYEDKIYQIYMDNKPFHAKGDRPSWVYDQTEQINEKKSILKFIKYDFLVMVLLIFILWISNRKEPTIPNKNVRL